MPNDDLISRKASIEQIEEDAKNMMFTSHHDRMLHDDMVEFAINAIECAPAVDAEPVVHSKWKMIPVNGVACYRCGNLNCARLMPFGCMPHELPRCPYCGAKMDKEE